jgi:3-phenylpropionate/trans-cinnamate dioxygenase ferredoxin reductase subunit
MNGMEEDGAIVIVGGGHAGAQLCAALAGAGLGARVHLVCEEPELPYQRPPLSKAFLKHADEALLPQRAEAWYAQAGITLHRGDPALAIDRARRQVQLRSGRQLPYAWLVLATGARARTLPALAGAEAGNVFALRSAADALRLRDAIATHARLTVIGGGFIGLEIAATARGLGKSVSVLESAPRLLMRSLSPTVSAHVLKTHREAGTQVELGVAVGGFELAGGRVQALRVDGVRREVDLLVLGVGAVPAQDLAAAAGLDCDNGIVVDEAFRSSDPRILAIGDCASFPEPTRGRRLRLESVQNAADQARAALHTLAGQPMPYRALPWFWSDQGGLRLQMAGLLPPEASCHLRPGATPASFSVLHYEGAQLACVESVNAPLDHLAARKLIESGSRIEPALACDPALPLKSHL